MPQTLTNGVTVPINSDAWNPTGDLATMGNSANVIIVVASQSVRDALTKTPGLTVWRQDINALEVCNGTIWSTVALGDTGWLAPTVFGNGFTAYAGSGFDGVKYRLLGKTLYVSGAAINGGSWASGVAICALPAGYIPSRKIVGTNCVVDTTGNVLTTTTGNNTTTTFSATYPLG